MPTGWTRQRLESVISGYKRLGFMVLKVEIYPSVEMGIDVLAASGHSLSSLNPSLPSSPSFLRVFAIPVFRQSS